MKTGEGKKDIKIKDKARECAMRELSNSIERQISFNYNVKCLYVNNRAGK